MTDSETIPVLLARIEELAAELALAKQQKRPPSIAYYFAKADQILVEMKEGWGFDLEIAQEDLSSLLTSNYLPGAGDNITGYVSSLKLAQKYTPTALMRSAKSALRMKTKATGGSKEERAQIIIEALKEAGLWSDLS